MTAAGGPNRRISDICQMRLFWGTLSYLQLASPIIGNDTGRLWRRSQSRAYAEGLYCFQPKGSAACLTCRPTGVSLCIRSKSWRQTGHGPLGPERIARIIPDGHGASGNIARSLGCFPISLGIRLSKSTGALFRDGKNPFTIRKEKSQGLDKRILNFHMFSEFVQHLILSVNDGSMIHALPTGNFSHG